MENTIAPLPQNIKNPLWSLSSGNSYVMLCFAYFAVIIGYYLFDPFGFEHPGRDTWHHLAVLRELMASPFDPSNPHLPTNEPSRYYTPLNVVAALIGRGFNLEPWVLFSIMGAVMCVAFCAVTWLFARIYYRSPTAPAMLLTIFLFAWGAQRGHAGFHNFGTFISSSGYPATQALVLGIFGWFFVLLSLEEQKRSPLYPAALALLTATIVLTHQFSAFIMLVGTGSFILFHRTSTIRKKSALLAALLTGGLLSLAWPYFNPLHVFVSAADPRWQSDAKEMTTISYFVLMAIPTIFGILGFRDRERNLVRWEIVAPIAFFTATYLLLATFDMSIAHRFPPAIILYLHLTMVWAIITSNYFQRIGQHKKLVVMAFVATFIGFSMYIASVPRQMEFVSRDKYGRMLPSVDAMRAYLPDGSIAFATKNIVYPLQSTGHRVVSIPRPEPVAPSLFSRQAATDKFFAADTTQNERRALLLQWNATHIAFIPADVPPRVIAALREFGPSRLFWRKAEIITVEPMENKK